MKTLGLLAALVAAGTMATPALADRPPTGEERAAIERVLRDQGFVSWEEIELDDDGPYWEVDDARTKDGRRWDLKLAPRSLEIVKRELDD